MKERMWQTASSSPRMELGMNSSRIMRTVICALLGVVGAMAGIYVQQVFIQHGTYAPGFAKVFIIGVLTGVGGFISYGRLGQQ